MKHNEFIFILSLIAFATIIIAYKKHKCENYTSSSSGHRSSSIAQGGIGIGMGEGGPVAGRGGPVIGSGRGSSTHGMHTFHKNVPNSAYIGSYWPDMWYETVDGQHHEKGDNIDKYISNCIEEYKSATLKNNKRDAKDILFSCLDKYE